MQGKKGEALPQMTREEYAAGIEALGYSQRAWARLTDQSFRGVSRKFNEGAAIGGPEATLLALVVAEPQLREWLEARRPWEDGRSASPQSTRRPKTDVPLSD